MASAATDQPSDQAPRSRILRLVDGGVQLVTDHPPRSLLAAAVVSAVASLLVDIGWESQDGWPALADLAHVACAAPLFAVVFVVLLEKGQQLREQRESERRDDEARDGALLVQACAQIDSLLSLLGSAPGAIAQLLSLVNPEHATTSGTLLQATLDRNRTKHSEGSQDELAQENMARRQVAGLVDSDVREELRALERWSLEGELENVTLDTIFGLLSSVRRPSDEVLKACSALVRSYSFLVSPNPGVRSEQVASLSAAVVQLATHQQVRLNPTHYEVVLAESRAREMLSDALHDVKTASGYSDARQARAASYGNYIYETLDS